MHESELIKRMNPASKDDEFYDNDEFKMCPKYEYYSNNKQAESYLGTSNNNLSRASFKK